MTLNRILSLSSALILTAAASFAGPVYPFGAGSAYSLLALGSSQYAGDINTQADVTGRVAAAHMVGTGTTIGSNIIDPYSTPNNYVLISPNGLNSGSSFNINASGGNVYAPGTNGNINFNGGGHRDTTGGSPIDFASLATYLESYSGQLGSVAANGTVGTTTDPNNPSFLALVGTSQTLNVFNLTAAQLASSNNNIDIIAPQSSTVLVNVLGSSATVGAALFHNGTQRSGDDQTDNKILFNFPTATTVTINGQFSASVLAPYAYLSGNAQMDGTFIAAKIGQTGEVHDPLFAGTLPDYTSPTPEPGSLALVGGALVASTLLMRRFRFGK